ncbi:MAG: hypothetical protein KBA98_08685, partial [Syntrophorhabdaceae bacterium]|nr:hypothetical protein [Syntrophorhabdaceae bacterium]
LKVPESNAKDDQGKQEQPFAPLISTAYRCVIVFSEILQFVTLSNTLFAKTFCLNIQSEQK